MRVVADFVTVPREGESHNGDAALVRRSDDVALLAVIDALGHGELAAAASDKAIAFLDEAPLDKGVSRLVEGLHETLRGTRGAAAMLLLVSGERLEGCGVGNVALRSYRAKVPAILTAGVLGGATLARPRIFLAQLSPGDRVVVHSDGVTARFDDEASRRAAPLEICRAIMQRHRRPHDDATVLVTDIEAS